MIKVSSKYNAAFAGFLKSVGGKWNAEAKVWEVPDDKRAEVEAKVRQRLHNALRAHFEACIA